MEKSDIVIRTGDTIEIINPEIITRIGYEFTYDDAVKEIRETYEEDILILLRTVKVSRWKKVTKEIVKSLAYDLIHKRIRTGNVRKIYTERREELIGKKVKVMGKSLARTGTYYPPTGGGTDYNGEYDYEPGGLKDPKTHVIFEFAESGVYDPKLLKIERCNVKLVS